MTTPSAVILPDPIWNFVNQNGEALGGGFLGTRLSQQPGVYAPVYQDTAENNVYPTVTGPGSLGLVIQLGLNGSLPLGPIYWDSATNYYVFVTDSYGNTIWSVDVYGTSVTGGGGGSAPITEVTYVENLIHNNTFYRHAGTDVIPPAAPPVITTAQLVTLAPGAHAGLSAFAASTNPNGPAASDICFIKNNLSATDTLQFYQFPLGSTLTVGLPAPVYYLNYSCSGSGSGELYKYIQFPITGGAQNLSGQTLTGTIYYRWNSGTATLTPFLRQFYGDGGGSVDQTAPASLTPTGLVADGSWQALPLSFTVPSAFGQTLGACGNDGLFLEIGLPLDSTCSIDITKPTLYIGTAVPSNDFTSNDTAEAICNEFRTGDIRTSLNSFSPFGWVPANDGSIGSSGSNVATGSSASTRADRDTFPLYNLLWNAVTSQTNGTNAGGTGYAQLYTSSGVPISAVGASAVADFAANNRIGLTKALGRILATAGNGAGLTARTLGENIGSEVITIAGMPSHNHAGSTVPLNNTVGGVAAGALGQLVQQSGGSTATLTITPAGGGILNTQGAADGNMPPVTFMNAFFKL